jgi:exopolysaccharide biosynthesis WecB/TagA/CpsF family protein
MNRMGTRIPIDDYDVPEFTALAAGLGSDRYRFVVTPNVDHLIRYYEELNFRAIYDAADYVLLDSRFMSHLLRLSRGIRLRVCPGSDLTERMFKVVIGRGDTIVLIGGSAAQARSLVRNFGLTNLQHINPPMGFIRDACALESCLRFIEAHSPFRFCFIAVGCPQQEVLAYHLKARGRACGLALCVGASINFLTGVERRAPRWMQRIGMEWSYRMLANPGRLGRRYLVRGLHIFPLLQRLTFWLRRQQRTDYVDGR